MNIYETATTEKSQVFFFRCTVCAAEHVSSSLLTTGQFSLLPTQQTGIYQPTSQNIFPVMY